MICFHYERTWKPYHLDETLLTDLKGWEDAVCIPVARQTMDGSVVEAIAQKLNTALTSLRV